MDESYKVYVKADENNNITRINSSAFLADTAGWIEIDEGIGDRYHHAQNHYLENPITDEYGRHNYKYIDGVVTEILKEENKPPVPPSEPSLEQKNRADIDYIGMMTGVL